MNKLLLALAATISLSATAGDFNIYTGVEGGGYYRTGVKIGAAIENQADKINKKLNKKGKEPVGFDVEVVESNGSVENIEALNDGDAQAIMVQMDALNVTKPINKVKVRKTGTEPVLWIYNKEHGYKDLDSAEGRKDSTIVVVEGGGGYVTLQNFILEDEDYGNNPIIEAMDLDDALDIVAEGEYEGQRVVGMVHVSASLPAEIVKEYASYVSIGEATDSDFNDATDIEGNKLYVNCEVNLKRMGGLSANTWTNPDTVCVDSAFVWDVSELNRNEQKVVQKAVRSSIKER